MTLGERLRQVPWQSETEPDYDALAAEALAHVRDALSETAWAEIVHGPEKYIGQRPGGKCFCGECRHFRTVLALLDAAGT